MVLIGRLKKLDKTITAHIVSLKDVTYEQFKKFLDSLDEERKSWSLDLQYHKNDKEFYDGEVYAIICVLDGEVIGLCNCYENNTNPEVIEISFVVKKEYQSQGIGSTLLKTTETINDKHKKYKYIIAKHFKDNIASHKAFLKAGYEEWTIDKIPRGDGTYFYKKSIMNDDTFDWKIKKI